MKLISIDKERVYRAGYIARTETKESPCNDIESFQWTMAYTPDGYYIGDLKTARRLVVKRGINPQPAKPSDTVCSIGFSNKDGKWYGWSHRAIFGFKIGSKCKKGDCHFLPSNEKEFIEDCERFYEGKAKKHGKNAISICKDGGGLSIICEFPTTWGRGEWTAKTVEDAKQMAIDFANSVG
jgi:hypothetical protein